MIDLLVALAILAQPSHPRLYKTPADIERARTNIQRFDWAREYFNAVKERADKWAAKSDAELRALVPPPGSMFAYGFSGCPECGANWPWWGAGGIASFDRPGKVQCPSCKRIFPDADHPDAGEGWKSVKDGKTYYFIGCYNSFAVQQVTLNILSDLSIAYAVTGDNKYSRAAASIYDSLANLYESTTEGSADYPSEDNYGRLERPQYQVARVLVLLADYLDLLYNSPEFATPSAGGKGSIREYIEEAVIRNGGEFCYDKATKGYMGLTNGQADYVRGALAAGLMLGVKDWIDCGVSGPYSFENFIENCLDRDGQYYETSIGYGDHALNVYADAAEMLYNYRSPDYPNGINLYAHPKFRKALFDARIDLDCFGHFPRFGDWGPDTTVVKEIKRYSYLPYAFSEYLAARAVDENDRSYWAAARRYICDGDVESKRSNPRLTALHEWMLFHADPVEKLDRQDPVFDPHPVLGAKGVAVLRSGKGVNGRAAVLRYGSSLNHGHYDDLNLNFFALGRELTYDLGYSLGSAHVQTGWSKQTASHNLVVVNEKSQLANPGGGGSAHLYVNSAPVRAFEASSEASYSSEGVKTYRRTLALVDISPGRSYLLDIFRVDDGKQHDLMWHFGGKRTKVEGVDMSPVQDTGSLAGPDMDWGRKVGAAGDLVGCADKGPYWVAPPSNGYGFLYNVSRSTSDSGGCAVEWGTGDGAGTVHLHLAPGPGYQLITTTGPGILPDLPKTDYAVVRRKGENLRSGFVSVVEPANASPAVKFVKQMECDADLEAYAVGVEVTLNGWTDYILSALKSEPITFKTSSGEIISFNGRFGFIRVKNGEVKRAVLSGGTELSIGSLRLSSPDDGFHGRIGSVDYKNSTIHLDEPVGSNYVGQMIYINGSGYSHNSAYTIKSVSKDGRTLTLDGSFVLGKGHIGDNKPEAFDAVYNIIPLPGAYMCSGKTSGYFNGRLLMNDKTGRTTHIVDVERDQRTTHVEDTSVFSPGDNFTIYDVQAGDEVYVPNLVDK